MIVDEGVQMVSYGLDESLIEFGAALEDLDFSRYRFRWAVCLMLLVASPYWNR